MCFVEGILRRQDGKSLDAYTVICSVLAFAGNEIYCFCVVTQNLVWLVELRDLV
jgi:hypothetical protein